MIFKYELRFVAFTMAESLLVGRNFMSGICKLKPEKNPNFCIKNLGFCQT